MATRQSTAPARAGERSRSRSAHSAAPRPLEAAPRESLVELDPASLPDHYGMKLSGTCLEPLLANGTVVIATKTERPRSGDLVIVYLRPHARSGWSHQAIIKRLVLMQVPGTNSNITPCIVVEQINPVRTYTFLWEDVEAIHKCLGAAPAGTTRPSTDTEKAQTRRTHARAAAGM